jgi:anti-sigma regulatory factor (Ser/Thr protein kinase)
MDDVHTLRLAGDYAELRRMSQWLRQTCATMGVASERCDELELCANEVVTNIISYGEPGEQAIELCLARSGAAARLTVEDGGRPFDPLAAELPAAPASLEEAPIGGLGIKLVRAMMADCDYERREDRNVFTMTTHP